MHTQTTYHLVSTLSTHNVIHKPENHWFYIIVVKEGSACFWASVVVDLAYQRSREQLDFHTNLPRLGVTLLGLPITSDAL